MRPESPRSVIPSDVPPSTALLLLAPADSPVRIALEGMEGVRPQLLDAWHVGVTEGRPGGMVVLDGALPPTTLLEVLVDLGASKGEWGAILVQSGEDGGLQGLPLSPGLPGALGAVVEAEARGAGLRALLRAVARARHDINNPLTSALAEVQLLLMDLEGEGTDGELRESLLLVQAQLRRIRDLVQELHQFRPLQG